MKLLLHAPDTECDLHSLYKQAFNNAVELSLVTAFLTEWDNSLELNGDCRRFRLIVGIDFGITRKAACQKIMHWLPAERKHEFLVADQIVGFHPKAAFWKERNGKYFAIIGSSNLTSAAFGENYEANIFLEISESEYAKSKAWIDRIESGASLVNQEWLDTYKEDKRFGKVHVPNRKAKPQPLLPLELPVPAGMRDAVAARRKALVAYGGTREQFEAHFRKCAEGEISSTAFYSKLSDLWNECRLQGQGWEIKGKHSDFRTISTSFLKIVSSSEDDRDYIVRTEIDHLASRQVPTRGAFLSEMLCLKFPRKYPILNDPIRKYLRAKKHKPIKGASEGSNYIHLARTLRSSLDQNPNHPAENLAELDAVIWLVYGKKSA
jgi:HKD family nuclease